MPDFKKIFSKPRVLLIVIHAESAEQVLRNAEIAFGQGADGIFLINHAVSAYDLLSIYEVVRGKYEKEWVGLNFLRISPAQAINSVPKTASGLWVDNAMLEEDNADPAKEARKLLELRASDPMWDKALYFGGVAFKYQKPVRDPARMAQCAVPCVDVVTTSGETTALAPPRKKIKAMKEAIGDFPLAMASGATPDNILQYVQYVDCFMAASGVSRTFTELDPRSLGKLAKIIS